MRTVVHIALICLLIARGSAPAHAAGACSNRYFLPVTDGATWVFSNEPKPRTIENVQKDNFEVHSALLVLAWRVAEWLGLDRWLPRLLDTPWARGGVHSHSGTEHVQPAPEPERVA